MNNKCRKYIYNVAGEDYSGKVLAIVGIDCSAESTDRHMKDLYITLTIVVVIAIIVSILGAILLAGRVTKNIKKIVHRIDDVVQNLNDAALELIEFNNSEVNDDHNVFEQMTLVV